MAILRNAETREIVYYSEISYLLAQYNSYIHNVAPEERSGSDFEDWVMDDSDIYAEDPEIPFSTDYDELLNILMRHIDSMKETWIQESKYE